jgi:hypothetical protein
LTSSFTDLSDFDYDAIHSKTKKFNLRPPLGAMFADYLQEYTHWGWVDLDMLMGDLSKLIEDLDHYDLVTYADGVFLVNCVA